MSLGAEATHTSESGHAGERLDAFATKSCGRSPTGTAMVERQGRALGAHAARRPRRNCPRATEHAELQRTTATAIDRRVEFLLPHDLCRWPASRGACLPYGEEPPPHVAPPAPYLGTRSKRRRSRRQTYAAIGLAQPSSLSGAKTAVGALRQAAAAAAKNGATIGYARPKAGRLDLGAQTTRALPGNHGRGPRLSRPAKWFFSVPHSDGFSPWAADAACRLFGRLPPAAPSRVPCRPEDSADRSSFREGEFTAPPLAGRRGGHEPRILSHAHLTRLDLPSPAGLMRRR